LTNKQQVQIAKRSAVLLILVAIAICLGMPGCTKSPTTNSTSSPGQPISSNPAKVEPTQAQQPPTIAEAREALDRVYRGAVTSGDAVVVGDFNGDGSEDLAIAVRPVDEKLTEINSEYANWIVADPKRVPVFDPKKRAQSLPATGPAQVVQGEALLAIVHGHGAKGWRDGEATQSYLLKSAAGSGMRVVPLRSYPPALSVRQQANLRADLITETLAGKAGFLYWATGKYAWHEQ
jgi:hypothetical protein